MNGDRPVLLVDDDFDFADSVKDVLADEGIEVVARNNGLEALEYLRTHPAPRLVILDWMMPICNGPQFRAEQISDPRLASIPVVLLTADRRITEKQSTLKIEHALSKPIDLGALLATIAQFPPG